MPATPAGHLSLRVEGLHPNDVPFLFERRIGRMGLFFFLTAAFDGVIAILIIVAGRHAPDRPAASTLTPSDSRIVWVAEPGAGGGGGGGGNQMSERPRQAQLRGEDRLSVPVAKPPAVDPQNVQEPAPIEPVIIPAQALGSAVSIQAGIIAPAEPSLSQGPGEIRGAGTGAGDGIGPGQGRGLEQGLDRGAGGDRFRPGNGVTPPVQIYVPKPQYTADAMRARVQGTVWVECVVERNGACTNTRVVRSLDPTFGLDDEAVKAARLFRFRPGMRLGEPVPVLVTIEMSFSLH